MGQQWRASWLRCAGTDGCGQQGLSRVVLGSRECAMAGAAVEGILREVSRNDGAMVPKDVRRHSLPRRLLASLGASPRRSACSQMEACSSSAIVQHLVGQLHRPSAVPPQQQDEEQPQQQQPAA